MYEDYKEALRKIRRYKRYLQNENKEKRRKRKLSIQEKNHRNIVYETEDGIMATLKEIEFHLSQEKRIYSNKHENNKIIINGQVEFGYIPLTRKNIGEIISNKSYREELYKILKEELSPQQFKVISLYYGASMTQEVVAQELGIDRATIAHYLEDAYDKIKKSQAIKTFLKMV
jgi:RNA polymerase sigma factor (sigma-70 family)